MRTTSSREARTGRTTREPHAGSGLVLPGWARRRRRAPGVIVVSPGAGATAAASPRRRGLGYAMRLLDSESHLHRIVGPWGPGDEEAFAADMNGLPRVQRGPDVRE